MTKYKDVLKIEFRECMFHFIDNKNNFHLYRINRALTNGSLINFDYHFLPSDCVNKVYIQLNLSSYGLITFCIDVTTSYGYITTKDYENIINNFLNDYDIYSEYRKV